MDGEEDFHDAVVVVVGGGVDECFGTLSRGAASPAAERSGPKIINPAIDFVSIYHQTAQKHRVENEALKLEVDDMNFKPFLMFTTWPIFEEA